MSIATGLRRTVLTAFTVVAVTVTALGSVTPASAQWAGPGWHRPGWGGGWHGGGWRGGYYGPRPYFSAYGGGCVVRRRWVPGPFGFHWVARRVCY